MVSLTCNHNIQETKAGRSKVQGQLRIHRVPSQLQLQSKTLSQTHKKKQINKSCVKYSNKNLQKYRHLETQEILLHNHTNVLNQRPTDQELINSQSQKIPTLSLNLKRCPLRKYSSSFFLRPN